MKLKFEADLVRKLCPELDSFRNGSPQLRFSVLKDPFNIWALRTVLGLGLQGKYGPVKACVRGQIHDSSPIDFVKDLGVRFATFSVSQRLGRSVYGLSSMSHAVANTLDALFWRKFELHRKDYWFALKESSVSSLYCFLDECLLSVSWKP